jgi:invasion protein IalB
MGLKLIRAIAGLSMAGLAATASAQSASTNQVAANAAWSVFVEKNPTECWGVSTAEKSVNTRDNRVVAVNRSAVVLMVFYRPEAKVKGQVTFTGGYPFAKGSTVKMEIGGSRFDLFTEGDWAWPTSEADDAKIVAAMRRGASAVLTARSARGTKTEDTFSLIGFTAAIEDAEKRCDG